MPRSTPPDEGQDAETGESVLKRLKISNRIDEYLIKTDHEFDTEREKKVENELPKTARKGQI